MSQMARPHPIPLLQDIQTFRPRTYHCYLTSRLRADAVPHENSELGVAAWRGWTFYLAAPVELQTQGVETAEGD